MPPNEANCWWTGRDVTVKVDVDAFTDVIAFQVASELQLNARHIYTASILFRFLNWQIKKKNMLTYTHTQQLSKEGIKNIYNQTMKPIVQNYQTRFDSRTKTLSNLTLTNLTCPPSLFFLLLLLEKIQEPPHPKKKNRKDFHIVKNGKVLIRLIHTHKKKEGPRNLVFIPSSFSSFVFLIQACAQRVLIESTNYTAGLSANLSKYINRGTSRMAVIRFRMIDRASIASGGSRFWEYRPKTRRPPNHVPLTDTRGHIAKACSIIVNYFTTTNPKCKWLVSIQFQSGESAA